MAVDRGWAVVGCCSPERRGVALPHATCLYRPAYHVYCPCPLPLYCPCSVVFTGEEGVDAGGVTREWYQVGC